MTKCEICDDIKRKDIKLFEDAKISLIINPKPSAAGHLIAAPKEHYPIIEQIPDFEIGHILNVANKASMALFESINVQGTNIIIQNGIPAGQKHPHVIAHIIPRRENDGLNLMWQPKQLSEEEMSTIELKLKKETENIGGFEKEKSKPLNVDQEKESISEKEGEENYLIKQLRRIP